MAKSEASDKARVSFAYALVSVALGFFAWLLDFNFCSTFQRFNLHAFAWHPLTALALLFAGEGFAAVTYIEFEEGTKKTL